MASFLRPVGPLPPSVYWRRRAVLLGIPLVLILAVAYSCGGSGSKPSAQATATPPAGTPSTGTGVIEPSVMPTGTAVPGNNYPPVGPSPGSGAPTAGAGSGSGPGAGPSGSAGSGSGSGPGSGPGSGSGSSGSGGSVGASGACALSLALTLDRGTSGGAAVYQTGQDPDFIIAAKNNGTGNCLLDVSGKGIVITVSNPADNSVVWTSSTCSGAADSRALGPGDSYQATTVWQRDRSEAACPKTPPTAGTGTFTVTATADGATAASVQFTLQ